MRSDLNPVRARIVERLQGVTDLRTCEGKFHVRPLSCVQPCSAGGQQDHSSGKRKGRVSSNSYKRRSDLPETPQWSVVECRLLAQQRLYMAYQTEAKHDKDQGSRLRDDAHRLSTIRTLTPARASAFAHITPAGPAPKMRTST